MSKGTKTASDAPALRMKVTARGLEPTTAYDQERLSSYRIGAEIWVHPTQEINPALRKFWAVLGKAVKDCKTPWKNTTHAADFLKIALGHTNQFVNHNGKWVQTPRSLTEFTLPEMEDFNLKVWGILFEVTGVDPLTMQAEAPAHEGVATQVDQVKAHNSVDDVVPPSEDSKEIARLIKEFAVKFWEVVVSNQTIEDRRGAIELSVPSWKEALPTRLDLVRSILKTSDDAIRGKIEIGRAKSMIAAIAGISEDELGVMKGHVAHHRSDM